MADPPDDEDDLFSHFRRNEEAARARVSDPDTSHDAAESLDETTVQRMERIVLGGVIVSGPRGATWLELWQYLDGQLPRQSISPRFKPLRKKGMIEERYDDNGKKIMRPGESNRNQTVWFATEAGKAWHLLKSARPGVGPRGAEATTTSAIADHS